ncbi:MAG: hypothetical protein ACPGGK_09805, partial [Pikeienuella sp.]
MISKKIITTFCGVGLLASCATPELPKYWSAPEHRSYIGVEADDSWCVHMANLREHLDGNGERPSDEARKAALVEVRAEAVEHYNGDPYWALRKGLACEYVQGAEEEIIEIDWDSGHEFLEYSLLAINNEAPESGLGPIVPVFDHLYGDPAASLEPVDLSNNAYCDALSTS